MAINETIQLFEQLAKQTHLQEIPQGLLALQPSNIRQAIESNNSQSIKASYCSPKLLANKTTIFDV